jgi:hypothetical protein
MLGVWPAWPVAGESGRGAYATRHANDDETYVNAQLIEI